MSFLNGLKGIVLGFLVAVIGGFMEVTTGEFAFYTLLIYIGVFSMVAAPVWYWVFVPMKTFFKKQ